MRRGRPVELILPPIASIADLAAAMASVAAAVAQGVITPDEAVALSQMVATFTRTLEATDVERRRNWRAGCCGDSRSKKCGRRRCESSIERSREPMTARGGSRFAAVVARVPQAGRGGPLIKPGRIATVAAPFPARWRSEHA